MASFVTACRVSARLAARKVSYDVVARGFRTSAASLAAQNFTMPALSPTMTEGNITSWRVKEGEKFVAGDVILEIETDKATMDVEAQEDGVMVKIMAAEGSKSVQVGTRIAVLAEEGDDLGSLELPADAGAVQTSAAKEESALRSRPSSSSSSSSEPAAPQTRNKSDKPQPQQKYPLLPSVVQLLHQNGLDESVVSEITPTGPSGRLLKGDVLAYLGAISPSAPADASARFNKLAHLDLSNIKVAAKAPEAEKAPKAAEPVVPVEEDALVTLTISLGTVIEVQKRVQESLGIFLPLSTFVTRATDLANDNLPRPAGAKPTADELFSEVLGLEDAGLRGSRGVYFPFISAIPPASVRAAKATPKKPADIFDMLSGAKKATPKPKTPALPGLSTGTNIFSLAVPKSEEKRAQTFLERIKLVLENEPGRLVL